MTKNTTTPILGALSALCVIAATVLAALGHPIPDFLPGLGIASVSALAGVSIPTPGAAPVTTLAAIQEPAPGTIPAYPAQ